MKADKRNKQDLIVFLFPFFLDEIKSTERIDLLRLTMLFLLLSNANFILHANNYSVSINER